MTITYRVINSVKRSASLIAWSLALLCCPTLAQPQTIDLTDLGQSYKINSRSLSYEPLQTNIPFEEVYKNKFKFKAPVTANPNYGFATSDIWMYSSLTNLTRERQWVIDVSFAQNEIVEIFVMSGDTVIFHDIQGKTVAKQRYRFPSFEVTLEPNQGYEVFLRVRAPSQSRVIPVSIQTAEHFHLLMTIDQSLWSIFYGGLLMLFLYSFVLFISNRDISTIAYAGYILTTMCFELVWGGHLHLFFNSPATQWILARTDLLFLWTAIGAGIFTLTFLNAVDSAPTTAKYLKAMLTIEILLAAIVIIGVLPSQTQTKLVYLVCIGAIASYLYAGFESYLNDYRPARYFVFSWGILLTAAMIGMLGLVGILPSNGFTTYCFQIGVFVESALFALAILEKSLHNLEVDVEIATDDLMNNLELIEEQNVHLDLARKNALKSSRTKSRFLANMSHEIRTPLNAIIGFSKELSTLNLPPEKQEYVQIINASATNLLAIVNDVLDFSKIEAGKLRIHQEEFHPAEMLEELVFINAKAANTKGLQFVYQCCPLPDIIISDPARLKQILNNLLNNAIKFTQTGHIALVVTSKSITKNRLQLNITVEDTGIGIEKKDLAKLFQAFSQLDEKPSRAYQGAGLGLVICQQLVQLMRGKLTVESVYRIGSQFKLSIICKQTCAPNNIHSSLDWTDKHIAIFDNNPFTRRSTAQQLHNLGAKVTSIDSVYYMASLTSNYDFLFVNYSTLRNRHSEHLQLLTAVESLAADEKVLLANDLTKLDDKFALQQLFDKQLETPLMASKLNTLMEQKLPDETDIWQQRLTHLPSISVLAVDDMEFNLKLLKTWLLESPIELRLCHSGQEAVDLCSHTDFDLILMDVQMPEMDGIEASRQIRKTRLNQGTPIIAVTAHALREEKEKLLNSGMDDYLAKPLDLATLINTMKRWSIGAEAIDSKCVKALEFDWPLAVKRANGNASIAIEMFADFRKQLPNTIAEIEHHAQHQHWPELLHCIHRLHGTTCYIGTPKLQHHCVECEKQLKNNQTKQALKSISLIRQTCDILIQKKLPETALKKPPERHSYTLD